MTTAFDHLEQSLPPLNWRLDVEIGSFLDLEPGQIVVAPIAYGLVPVVGAETVFDAYQRFRTHVYLNEAGIIDLREDAIQTDFDEDDLRSVHLAAVERTRIGFRIVGSMRIILRGEQVPRNLEHSGLQLSTAPLPVEVEFAEVFDGNIDLRASTVSCELSRYISRHESKRRKMAISSGLHRVAVTTVTINQIGPTYAIVERWLDRILRMARVPLDKLCEPRLIPKYGTENYAVEIHMYDLARRLGGSEYTVVLDHPTARAS